MSDLDNAYGFGLVGLEFHSGFYPTFTGIDLLPIGTYFDFTG